MSNNTDDPSSPASALSKMARAAHWVTGGTNRGPSTMSSFSRMTRDRNDINKATKAWDQARGKAPRPRGRALIRWYREGGGGVDNGGDGHNADHGDAARQPEMHQQEHIGPVDSNIEIDIYGADDTTGARAESDNTGGGDTEAGTVPGDASGRQQAAEGGDDDHQGGPAGPAQQQREETASPGS